VCRKLPPPVLLLRDRHNRVYAWMSTRVRRKVDRSMLGPSPQVCSVTWTSWTALGLMMRFHGWTSIRLFVCCHRFGDCDIVRAISETIQTQCKEPFTCWRDSPDDHKRFWWNCFKVMLIHKHIGINTCIYAHISLLMWYICIRAWARIYTRIYAYIHVYRHTDTYIHAYMHTHAYLCTYRLIYEYIFIYAHRGIHTRIYAHIRIYMFVYVCICLYTRIFHRSAYMRIYACVYLYTHICAYIRICRHTDAYLCMYMPIYVYFLYTRIYTHISVCMPTYAYVGIQMHI